ncbi:hypothetical protein [Dactylosporangium sp. NPDC048998]|uniref:hypothetical protein n=1 Tax=Dactylosporangium sp. NPDC048998 TaxID=3363976 RepID=UPI0037104664
MLFALSGASACTAPSGKPSPSPSPGELLLVRRSDGLAVLDTGTGRQVAGGAVVTSGPPAAARLVTREADGRVVVRDGRTGAIVTAAAIQGDLRLAAVAPDAALVALVGGDPLGRKETTVVVAGPAGEQYRLTVPGFVEPEAFNFGGSSLFVLDMLPPEHPDRYRVRCLDLQSGRLNALNLPGENAGIKVLVPTGAEEEMRGQGRQAVFDPDRNRLFTLYSHQPDHQHVRDLLNPGARDSKPDVHAFVHTLNVADGWAVCVDLPGQFGTGPAEGLTIARSRNEVWTADAGVGSLVQIEPSALVVNYELAFPATPGKAALWADVDDVLLAVGRSVRHFESPAKRLVAEWPLPGAALGVAASKQHVYVGQADGVLRLDRVTGQVTAQLPVAGLTGVERIVG